ncbi:hypothetical protein NRB20_75370 [Nocardia sp. RB20]|uniref:Uncharacterized protein n=1 Tax=Nocardia macrotermitis TaxID=2585198 RepID=A0A7K0DGI1_9NOCA|nr:hypothetical protein [Nocardia macrotermitis]
MFEGVGEQSHRHQHFLALAGAHVGGAQQESQHLVLAGRETLAVVALHVVRQVGQALGAGAGAHQIADLFIAHPRDRAGTVFVGQEVFVVDGQRRQDVLGRGGPFGFDGLERGIAFGQSGVERVLVGFAGLLENFDPAADHLLGDLVEILVRALVGRGVGVELGLEGSQVRVLLVAAGQLVT